MACILFKRNKIKFSSTFFLNCMKSKFEYMVTMLKITTSDNCNAGYPNESPKKEITKHKNLDL